MENGTFRGTFDIKDATFNPIAMKVSHSGGRPILFFDRNKRPDIPEGDTEVRVDDKQYVFQFRKIAVNVATEKPGGPNILAALLRGWYGITAGLPGSRRSVFLEQSEAGWILRRDDVEGPSAGGEVIPFPKLPYYAELDVACGAFRDVDRLSERIGSVSLPQIAGCILEIRQQRVILDTDLADLYGVTTSRLNEQVKRNRARFPNDFKFQLTDIEKNEVIANCDHLAKLKFSKVAPYASTEHGAIMAASVLNTPLAVDVSVYVVRAFIQLRSAIIAHSDLARKIADLEQKYDSQFKVVFDAVRQLMAPVTKTQRRIGFGRDE